eukprot:scaffold8070_cov117-Cylindrotheca_fusiformis.AAC.20
MNLCRESWKESQGRRGDTVVATVAAWSSHSRASSLTSDSDFSATFGAGLGTSSVESGSVEPPFLPMEFQQGWNPPPDDLHRIQRFESSPEPLPKSQLRRNECISSELPIPMPIRKESPKNVLVRKTLVQRDLVEDDDDMMRSSSSENKSMMAPLPPIKSEFKNDRMMQLQNPDRDSRAADDYMPIWDVWRQSLGASNAETQDL